MTAATLHSSFGDVVFDAATGFVVSHTLEPDFGPAPYKVDVDEWRLNYPGETLSGSHDILDFGYWFRKPGETKATYEPPAEEWRAETGQA